MSTVIRRGATGPEVRDVQARLARLAEAQSGEDADGVLVADGVFGPRTQQAVRRFQRDRGLAADGIIGPETWRALVEAGYSLGDRLLWHTRVMMRGDDVRELQHRLNELGFDAGSEDGIFGPLTQSAVEEFQRNTGLDVDGTAGRETVDALRRLRRGHQAGGIGIRAREREALRQLSDRGLVGTSVLIDPSHGEGDPGAVGPSGIAEAAVTWQLAMRLAARLGALGAHVVLSRGPRNNPPPGDRARLANEQGVALVMSIATNAWTNPEACGASTYYFGAPHFVSEAGYRLATLAQHHMVEAGWTPDCRVHPVTWAMVRETRMPAVVVEPGFLTSPVDERRLADPARQETLAAALSTAIASFLDHGVTPASPSLHALVDQR